MATAFRDWPWPLQALFFLGLAVVVIAAGFYVPGSPVATVRASLEAGSAGGETAGSRRRQPARLQAAPRRTAIRDGCTFQTARYAADHRSGRQADRSIHHHGPDARPPVPAFPFASSRLCPLRPKPFYFEMPFEIDADGPYFSILDFFAKLGRLSRIINVGDLKLTSISGKSGSNFSHDSGDFRYRRHEHHHVLFQGGRRYAAGYNAGASAKR